MLKSFKLNAEEDQDFLGERFFGSCGKYKREVIVASPLTDMGLRGFARIIIASCTKSLQQVHFE